MGEGVTELICIQNGLHNAVYIHFVAGDEGITIGIRLVPLYSDVAEIACSVQRDVNRKKWNTVQESIDKSMKFVKGWVTEPEAN